MPAVLIEMGYLTNPDQEKLLATDAFQNAFVQAMYEAVVRFRDTLVGRRDAMTAGRALAIGAAASPPRPARVRDARVAAALDDARDDDDDRRRGRARAGRAGGRRAGRSRRGCSTSPTTARS